MPKATHQPPTPAAEVDTYPQPDTSDLAPEVFHDLMALAESFDQRQYFSAALMLRNMATSGESPAFGNHWSVVHKESGQVVNYGFSIGADSGALGVRKHKLKGFEMRVIALFTTPQSEGPKRRKSRAKQVPGSA